MGMEPEVRDFLTRVVWSIGAGLLYLIINSTIGIAGGWFFFADSPTLGNYIFYVWFVGTTVGLVVLMIKLWKKKFPHG